MENSFFWTSNRSQTASKEGTCRGEADVLQVPVADAQHIGHHATRRHTAAEVVHDLEV